MRGAVSSVSREATVIVVRELPAGAAWEAGVLRGTLACHRAALVLGIGICYYTQGICYCSLGNEAGPKLRLAAGS